MDVRRKERGQGPTKYKECNVLLLEAAIPFTGFHPEMSRGIIRIRMSGKRLDGRRPALVARFTQLNPSARWENGKEGREMIH